MQSYILIDSRLTQRERTFDSTGLSVKEQFREAFPRLSGREDVTALRWVNRTSRLSGGSVERHGSQVGQ